MSAPELPGYYFDSTKKRYFKIETRGRPGATWTPASVKRRKVADQEAALALEQSKGRIKRAKVLSDPITGGFLAREYGMLQEDVQASRFATGLVEKGVIPLADAYWGSSFNINAMCITAEDTHTGLGVGYASIGGRHVVSTYLPRDSNGLIHRRLLADYRTPLNQIRPYQEQHSDAVTSIKFHRPSGVVLVGCSFNEFGLRIFKPSVQATPEPMVPAWSLGVLEQTETSSTWQPLEFLPTAIAPCLPGNPTTLCAFGSERGLLEYIADAGVAWVSPESVSRRGKYNPYRDLFAVAYQEGNPNVLLAGGRPQTCFVFDKRSGTHEPGPMAFHHAGSITHIRSLSEHHVLVSGIRNTMCIYDLRKSAQSHTDYKHSTPEDRSRLGTPVLRFPQYRNSAHLFHGLDVDVETGIVAVAHKDGAIAIHSLKSGRQLSRPWAADPNAAVVQVLQFQKMAGDHTSSLFAGVGSNIHAWSFGVRDHLDEA